MDLETKTLNQWMRSWGYYWAPGLEQMNKGLISESDARTTIAQLMQQGAVRHG